MKRTLVLGATNNPSRYAYLAVKKLQQFGHEVVPVSLKKGEVADLTILTRDEPVGDIDTVTLYVGSQNLHHWYDYILGLNPKRIIFNPGTENDELAAMAQQRGIQIIENCTLVMLSVGSY